MTGTQSDPTDALIVDAFERKLRGAELRKRISQASAAHYEIEYGHGLPARAERSAVYAFTKALENGGADTIIASLTTRFDAAAKALTECAEHIDPNMDPDTALRSSTDDRVRVAWQDIDRHVNTLDKVAAVVTQFGGKSLTFGLIELPNSLGGTGRLDDRALMAVDHQKLDITRASAIFNQPGTHRPSTTPGGSRAETQHHRRGPRNDPGVGRAGMGRAGLQPRPGPDGRRQVHRDADPEPVRRTEVTAPPPPLLIFPRPRVFG